MWSGLVVTLGASDRAFFFAGLLDGLWLATPAISLQRRSQTHALIYTVYFKTDFFFAYVLHAKYSRRFTTIFAPLGTFQVALVHCSNGDKQLCGSTVIINHLTAVGKRITTIQDGWAGLKHISARKTSGSYSVDNFYNLLSESLLIAQYWNIWVSSN
jgi:hypothetical protein